ncbi:hypothetical protein ATANTOWER_011885 [Ataeniobius toweri]|uniref:Uncharacterized protein n=1 Tax=Ataeniobius toweri TaxID=208326 RepID=A0ABU7A6T0_9TELE|nr:hypothetical protein [Ataeniobius toweri]
MFSLISTEWHSSSPSASVSCLSAVYNDIRKGILKTRSGLPQKQEILSNPKFFMSQKKMKVTCFEIFSKQIQKCNQGLNHKKIELEIRAFLCGIPDAAQPHRESVLRGPQVN